MISDPVNKLTSGDPLTDVEIANSIARLDSVIKAIQWLDAPEYKVAYRRAVSDWEKLRSYQDARRRG